MASLTLQQVFGSAVYQDADYLVINKQDFSNLSASDSNTGESLLAAILLNTHYYFEGVLTDELSSPITDESGTPITFNNSGLYDLLNVFFWKRQFNILQQPTIIDTFIVERYEIQ